MQDSVHVGIDLGTSGVRGCAINAAGNTLAQARQPLPASRRPHPGWSEQDPHDWWNAVLAVLDPLLDPLLSQALTPHRRVTSICVDGTSSTLLLAEPDGTPLTPGLMYDDRRAVDLLPRLAALAPKDSPVHTPGSTLAKWLWLQRHHPLPNDYRLLHQADWIAGKLSGEFATTDENNPLKLGYDPIARRWPAWLQQFDLNQRALPEVLAVGQRRGTLTAELTRRWRLAQPPGIVAGTTDSNAATLASGVRATGEASTALGSTLVLKVVSDQPVFAAAYGVYSHRIGDRWLVGGASNSGGSVLRQHFTPAQLVQLSARIDPHSDSGLDYYPLPEPGERFPINDPRLPPRLSPAGANDTQFLHGLLEGIARIEQLGYQRLHSLGAPLPTRVYSTGGGAANTTWQRIRQRILGCPVEQATHTEAAYGAALIAAGRHLD